MNLLQFHWNVGIVFFYTVDVEFVVSVGLNLALLRV